MKLPSRIAFSKNLPTLPQILLNLIDVCNRDDSTIDEMSQIINTDPSLSANVMRLINSAYYSLPNRVTTTGQAIVLLGTDAIKNIAISSSVYQVFDGVKGDSVFKRKLFWWHSLMCATLARLIAGKSNYSSPDEAFLSGLLHDIGKLALLVNFPEEYPGILRSSSNRTDLLLEGEKRLGGTHCEVGSWMLDQWKMKSFIADAVLYHHEPLKKILDASPLVKITFVANILSSENLEANTRYRTAEEVFGFGQSETEGMLVQAGEEVEKIAQLMGIEIELPDNSDKDREKEKDLTYTVRNISFLQGTLQNLIEAYGESSILKVIRQGFQVLFDVNNALFFLYDQKRDVLAGKGGMSSGRDLPVEELFISLQSKSKESLLVKSLRHKMPLDSFGLLKKVELTIMDRQVIHLIGREGMICLPMVAHKNLVGVIVSGVNETEVSKLQEQIKLLTMFANQAALALHANYLRETQSELIQAERLAASSAMARKVSHEVNNPLGIIKNYLSILGMKLTEDNAVQEELKIIKEEIDRVSSIVNELADFSEIKVLKEEPVNINKVISDLIKIMQDFLLKSKIGVHLDLDSSLPTTTADKDRIKQVFINLIKNGVEAMPHGGNIHVQTRCIKSALIDEVEQGKRAGRDYLEITITDEGPGIPDTIKSQLFEPYVSSKGSGHAGLGLSIVYGIIKELNGTISCESNKEMGTSFKIVLPVV